MAEKFYLHTLGCKVNAYETFALGQELMGKGMEETDDFRLASVIVLNTCSVTAKADQKSRQHISRFKRENPDATLLVMGCYSQSHAEECVALGADVVLGAAKRKLAVSYILKAKEGEKPIVDLVDNIRKEEYEELGTLAFCDNARVYLKIQDGCDNFCSYCFIPRLRGNSRSREPRDIINEAKMMAEKGYKEIIVTGIHIGMYGKDLGDGSFRLADLLEALLNKVPNVPRIRISSLEESEIDDKFLSLLRRYPRIVDHLHIPLQSGSSEVLRKMARHYDTDAFLSKLNLIREIRPDIAITTDVIAGFPTESEENWKETMAFCEKANFAEIHVFPFSSRPGTAASRLKDTDPKVKKARVAELLSLSHKKREEYKARFYGRELNILYEDYDEKKHIAYGHSENYLKVAVYSDRPRHGELEKMIYTDSVASD
ncbi:MAG: tRNA (N(6)-L-threonylcarbamoyladenosine(37)-C(2))-methylthiotransferase MtaB [Bacilli bacterium]|nr:tRNA (N(6)-L-threonylcarbamoyladenosine(37)-C(2))-methylthiotransferase MtaB [Bacilli bacterium]